MTLLANSLKAAVVAALLGIFVATPAVSHGAVSAESERDFLKADPASIEAWKDMRFGMFICWGPVTLTGHEIGWSRGRQTPIEEYDNLYKRWNPTNFDAEAWVQVAKEAGCKYIVFLTKHHDGFCLWDSKQTDYDIMSGPFKRDITKEVADACKKYDIAFFPYYSTCDWHHPDFPGTGRGGKTARESHNLDRYTEYLKAQSKELIENYGPLLGIWYDIPQHFNDQRAEDVIHYLRGLQPSLLVNNRLSQSRSTGDFDTPEQHVGRFNRNQPWESCMTLGTQWSWKPDDQLKSWQEIVQMLVVTASGDGNLALNTNPMPDGPIEPRQVEVFKKIGEWTNEYGESIYGTRGGPFIAPDAKVRKFGHGKTEFTLSGGGWWGGSTHRENTVYLHILRWPSDTIVLPDIGAKVRSHKVLTGGKALLKQTDASIEVTVPENQRHALDTIIQITFDQPIGDVTPVVAGKPMPAQKASANAP